MLYAVWLVFQMGVGLPNVSMASKVNASSSRRGAPAVFKFVLHDLDCSLDKPGSKYLVFTAHLSNSPRSSSVDSGVQENTLHTPPLLMCQRAYRASVQAFSKKCGVFRDLCCFFDWAGGFDQVMSALSGDVNCF